MLKTAGVLVVFAALACAAAPDASRMPAVAPGITVGGVRVGGLTSEPARARVERAFGQPLHLFYGSRRFAVAPDRLGAGASVDEAVSRALAARGEERVPLTVTVSASDVASYVAQLAKRIDRKPVDAHLVGFGSGPIIAQAKPGVAVRRAAMRRLLGRALEVGVRAPLPVLVRPVKARLTRSTFGPVILIDRGRNMLRLYSSRRLVRTFGVATGRAQYPTPSGIFAIVDLQRDPWWRPPSSPWAQGLKAIPPGPGNPLGTRWMGLSAAGVGIHGTPDDASIGYSASHGCIRMHIPDAAWLFEHVHLGTPVEII